MPDEPQQPIYTPTDILNIVKEYLRTSNIPIVIEGVYQMVGTKAYNGGIWWYDEIRSQFEKDGHRLIQTEWMGREDQRRTIRRTQHYGKTSDGITRQWKNGISFV